jgi:hypothetical protein
MNAGCSLSTVSLPCWILGLQFGLSIKSTLPSSNPWDPDLNRSLRFLLSSHSDQVVVRKGMVVAGFDDGCCLLILPVNIPL